MSRPIGALLAACTLLTDAEQAALSPEPSALALAWVAFARLEAVLSQALMRLDGAERATADRRRAEAVELMLLANGVPDHG